MKKIYFILPGITFGGAERVIFTLLNNLNYLKFNPTLILLRKDGMPLTSLNPQVNIRELKVNKIRFSIFKIFLIIWREKPDLVFMGWGEMAAFLSPFIPIFKKTKFIARETNIVSEHVKRKEILFFYKFYNNFHKIIAQSDDMIEDLTKNIGVKKEKITKINNPVDVDKVLKSIDSDKKNLFDKNKKNVLVVGNLSHRKGFDNLLKVFVILKNKPIHLYIIGDGAEKNELLYLKNDLGLVNVHFLGLKANPYPYMAQADLFVLSSRYEGFPNVLLEAGVCGLYSIANQCKGGIDEIIQEKINGTICNINDREKFASKIVESLEHQPNKQEISKSITERFGKDNIMPKYNAFFNQCFDNSI